MTQEQKEFCEWMFKRMSEKKKHYDLINPLPANNFVISAEVGQLIMEYYNTQDRCCIDRALKSCTITEVIEVPAEYIAVDRK